MCRRRLWCRKARRSRRWPVRRTVRRRRSPVKLWSTVSAHAPPGVAGGVSSNTVPQPSKARCRPLSRRYKSAHIGLHSHRSPDHRMDSRHRCGLRHRRIPSTLVSDPPSRSCLTGLRSPRSASPPRDCQRCWDPQRTHTAQSQVSPVADGSEIVQDNLFPTHFRAWRKARPEGERRNKQDRGNGETIQRLHSDQLCDIGGLKRSGDRD